MRSYSEKTNHFLLRQWERKVDNFELSKILSHFPKDLRRFSGFLIVGIHILKKVGIKTNEHLIIVLENGKFITLYFEKNLFQFLIEKKGQLFLL